MSYEIAQQLSDLTAQQWNPIADGQGLACIAKPEVMEAALNGRFYTLAKPYLESTPAYPGSRSNCYVISINDAKECVEALSNEVKEWKAQKGWDESDANPGKHLSGKLKGHEKEILETLAERTGTEWIIGEKSGLRTAPLTPTQAEDFTQNINVFMKRNHTTRFHRTENWLKEKPGPDGTIFYRVPDRKVYDFLNLLAGISRPERARVTSQARG